MTVQNSNFSPEKPRVSNGDCSLSGAMNDLNNPTATSAKDFETPGKGEDSSDTAISLHAERCQDERLEDTKKAHQEEQEEKMKKKREKETTKAKNDGANKEKKSSSGESSQWSSFPVIGGAFALMNPQGPGNDDHVDRLNHVGTVFLFAVFAIVVSTSQFVGDPIHCWTPAEFPKAYVAYATTYCWIKNTYYIPMDSPIPVEEENRSSEELTYYQWVPYILFLQALMFKLPNIVWRLFNGMSGIDLNKIVDMAQKTQMGSEEDRDKAIHHIAKDMDRWLEADREYSYNMLIGTKQWMARLRCCFFCTKRRGTYLTALYLFIKVAYTCNAICQFLMLNAFLSMDYSLYGFETLKMLGSSTQDSIRSPRFPLVTLCDFKIRQHQNIQNWTVQCVLPINLFNEKIFMIIWFWLVVVAFITLANLFSWMYNIIFKRINVRYIKGYVKHKNELHNDFYKKLCNNFVRKYLRHDGVFVIRVVAKNSTELVAIDLVDKLWKIFIAKKQEILNTNTRPSTRQPTKKEKKLQWPRILTRRGKSP